MSGKETVVQVHREGRKLFLLDTEQKIEVTKSNIQHKIEQDLCGYFYKLKVGTLMGDQNNHTSINFSQYVLSNFL